VFIVGEHWHISVDGRCDVRITDENISGKVLDHLGIEKLGLIEKIDKRLPLNNPKTTMGLT
jgi:hypothetical protein